MKESLISALDFRGVGKMHRSPEDETSGVYVMTAVQPFFTSSRDNYSGKKLACEQALQGAQAAGAGKGTRACNYVSSWNLNSTSNSPVAPCRLSCQIPANQREAETSANVNKH